LAIEKNLGFDFAEALENAGGFVTHGIHSTLLFFDFAIDIDEMVQKIKIVDVEGIQFLFEEGLNIHVCDEWNVVLSCRRDGRNHHTGNCGQEGEKKTAFQLVGVLTGTANW